MEDRKASNEASFEKLKTVLDEQKAKYEVISKNNEAFTYHYSYLIYSLHSAAPNGSWCGDQRQLSAANGTLN